MATKADFVIINAAELVTLDGSSKKPKVKEDMDSIGIIQDGAVAVKEGKIVTVGPTSEVLSKLEKGFETIDAYGKLVAPGLIDPHVHLIWEGQRADEMELMGTKGVPYLEIKARGGGMPTTLEKTQQATTQRLIERTTKILDTMLIHGTTTIEAKSGYEMTYEGEIRQLEVIQTLNKTHPVDLVSTFCAQGITREYETRVDELTDEIVEKWIPEMGKRKLAEYADVFCEEGYFNLEQTQRILEAGKKHGMKLRIHGDWLVHSGGAKLGADLKVVSADHLIFTPMEVVDELVEKGTVGVLLPTSPFCYIGTYAKARELIERGLPIALATDVSAANMCESMQMMMALAILRMKMTCAEALTAATINAAHSIERAQEIGSLEVGKKADIVIFDAPNHQFFSYHYGINLAEKVFKNGKLVAEKGRRVY
ncbi:MAG: imidazolonepropionase [Candidatus Hodarchaeales archaeon]|jgi:imidazolonepropionase